MFVMHFSDQAGLLNCQRGGLRRTCTNSVSTDQSLPVYLLQLIAIKMSSTKILITAYTKIVQTQ